MDCSRLHAHMIVADLLNCFPELVPVFIRHRMACPGCLMAPFETIAGAADVYGLELQSFLCELQEMSSPHRAHNIDRQATDGEPADRAGASK
jgi:hybrid cluster-associated redox disulfide protein